MTKDSYSSEILIFTKAALLYEALSNDIDKWWTLHCNKANALGDKLNVRFEKNTSWTMQVTKAEKHTLLVWKVIEAHHNLITLSKKDEWLGTIIHWKITEVEAGCILELKHEGLKKELQCYQICEAGWDYFLESLKSYLESGKGYAYKDKA